MDAVGPIDTQQSVVREGDGTPSARHLRIAVTGANGFIGTHLVRALRQQHISVLSLVRRQVQSESEKVVDLANPDVIATALEGIDVLVHCAGLAHAHEENSADEDELHMLVNCNYVLNSARAAARAGVTRFVFCSSVKAVGDPGTQCRDESFDALPSTAYGRAKRAAEEGLMAVSAATGLQTVILRLAMVYGPGSRGNLERMLRLVARGRFPPLPESENKRSMVFVSDVVDAIMLAASHPAAGGRIYNVAHPRAVSGRELYDAMRVACQKPKQHWAIPAGLLRLGGRVGDLVNDLLGLRVSLDSQSVSRLLDSAHYSSAAIQSELGWNPRTDIAAGIEILLPNSSIGCEDGKTHC
jgi:UDP-glucose 4-epimerase